MSDDLIERQAAIDALGEEPEVWTGKDEYAQGLNNQWHYDVNSLKALPSAQPEKRTEKRTETHACDLIDREAAVDAIYHHLPSVSRTRARTMLHEVPSAQPELRRGDES